MNILEQQANINNQLSERCKHILSIVNKAMERIDPDSDSIVHWYTGYYGYEVSFYETYETKWIDNPNYNPNLTSNEHQIPENIEKHTASQQIPSKHESIVINAFENTDPYEDWEGEKFNTQITKDLFLNGTDDQIFDYFVEMYKTGLETEKERKFNDHWRNLLRYNFNELEKIVKIAKQYYSTENGTVEFSNFIKILEEFKNG